MDLRIKRIKENYLSKELFGCFNRHQEVTRVFRAKGGKWVIKDAVFTEEWGENEKEELVRCLANTLQTRGIIYGAFDGNRLIGFFSIEGERFGSQNQYVELSSLHVDYDYRGRGIGRKLFDCALSCAGNLKAKKLYISSHSAVETQAFYRSMGCVEAAEFNPDSLAKEPCDCHLEYSLTQRPGSYMALYMCLGMPIGMLFGMTVFHNLSLGMCLGIAVGMLFGVSLEVTAKNRTKEGNSTDQSAGAKPGAAVSLPQPVIEGGTTYQPDNWDSNVGGVL